MGANNNFGWKLAYVVGVKKNNGIIREHCVFIIDGDANRNINCSTGIEEDRKI